MSIIHPENAVQIVRGSSKTLELTVTTEDGTAVDLTGARVILSVKRDAEDPVPLIQKDSNVGVSQAEITEPRAGKAQIHLEPADTQNLDPTEYVFDVWAVLASGKRYPVVPPSIFEVLSGVTILPL